MAEISREEFMRLQSDAERRLREMQQRSREAVGIPSPDFVKMREEPKSIEKAPPPPPSPSRGAQGGGLDFLRLLNLKNITSDPDRLLILAVLLLLATDGGDRLLTAALIYIML